MRESLLLKANACNKLFPITFLVLGLLSINLPLFSQQASIDFSTYLGGTGSDIARQVAIDADGATYLLAYSFSSDFPVTDESTFGGSADIVLAKYDTNNVLIYARYIGGGGYDYPVDVKIDGDNIYILSRSYKAGDFPVTDGSVLKGFSDVLFTRVDATTGAIEFASYIGGMNSDESMEMEIENGDLYVLVNTYGDDFPVTDGSTKYSDEDYVDIVLMKMDSAANIEYATYLGPYAEENFGTAFMEVANGEVYVSVATDFDNYPVTDGSEFIPDATMVLSKIGTSGEVVYATYLFNELTAEEAQYSMFYNDGKIYFLTVEDEGNIDQSFVTDGSLFDNTISTSLWTVFNAANGQSLFGSFRNAKVNQQMVYDKSAWLVGEVDNETIFLTKFDEFQQEVYTTTFPGEYVRKAYVDENGIYLFTYTSVAGLSTTDGSTLSTSGSDLLLTILDHDGQLKYLGYLGGVSNDYSSDILVNDTEITVVGYQYSSGSGNSYPVTDGSSNNGLSDVIYTKLNLCPNFPPPKTDTLSPSKQLVCKNGLISQIKGNAVILSGDSLPTIFLGGVPKKQNDIVANYQWQESTTAVGPWINITGETQRNFTPQPIVTDRYFRRLSLTNGCCGNDTISISNVDTVLVNAFTAPTVDAGGIFNTCPNVNVTIDATVTGGLMPYQYDWDMGATDIEDPIVAPAQSTVFTLLVTDKNNCQQLSQAVVNTYSADAGPETASACAGDSVQIGGTPVAGLAGVTYDWTPNTELSCIDCAQPFANPTIPRTYELTLTIPVTGASTCQTTDQIEVSPISAPTIADFAGPDITICRGSTGTIGTTPESFEIDITAVAQSSAAAGFTGTIANLTDNDFTTGARTNSESGPWISIDLGEVYSDVNRVDIAAIDAANLNGGLRRIEVSTDNASWQFVTYISTATNNSLTTITFGSRDARYIRFRKLSSAGVLDLSEIRVYQTFNYTWAPGNYLTNNQLGQTTFQPGSLSLPSPNPILYYLTAERGGCVFVDEMSASVIEARAGVDGCGPRTVGESDRTPNINETYEWVKISGSGNFIGATDGITAEVSASVGTDTEYEIRVTSNGTTCTDRVIVPPTCGCVVDIAVDAPFACPSLGLNELEGVQLRAIGAASPSIDPSSFVYTWSVISGPSGGLSSTSGALVSLTDTIQRTYRVTFTSTQNTGFSCTRDIEVNHPAWSLPIFSAVDVSVCANVPVAIGEPVVADYTYEWSNEDKLNQSNISMPTATVNGTTDFVVTVTDTRSGCTALDTLEVEILTVTADAGKDFLICDNSTITLGGSAAQPNATYAWNPTNANWQNGTDENDAQPEVLVAINQEFTLEVTSTIGNCIDYDTMMVTVGTPVSPFSLNDITYCPSDGAVTIGTGVPAGFTSYSWSPASLLADASIQSPQTLDPPPANQTDFVLVVQNSSGCEMEAIQTIIPNISGPNAGSNKVVCLGEDVNLGSADNPTGAGISYAWTGTASGELSSTSSPNPIFSPSAAGVFTFTLTKNDNGCQSTAEVSITVNEFSILSIAPITICQGTAVEIGTTPESGVQYLWQPSTNLSDSTIANPIVSNLTATTTYTLSAIGLNNCPASTDVLVGVNTVPAPTILLQDTIVCLGEESVIFNPIISPVGNYNYAWSPNDGSIANIYSEQAEVTIFGTGTTNYTLQVTNADNGCSSSEHIALTVTPNCDWGDLPDVSNNLVANDYQTLRANNGPVHIITPNLFLGNEVDGESEGQPNFTALGDGSDEDGLTILSKMNFYPGGTFRLPFNYTNNSGETAFLEGWIDWNGDGDFDEGNEMILQTNDGNGSSPFPNFWEINIPTTAVTDAFLGMRVRLSNQADMTPYGKITSGEVEDYLIYLDCKSEICLPPEGVEVKEE